MTPQPIPPAIAAVQRPRPELLKYYVIQALFTNIVSPITMLVLYFRYHTMRYRFDAEGIHMSWGLIMRHEIMLNYSRIQDIQLKSNVIERYLGLARIEIQTASGTAGSEMTLEGIPDYTAMRDFLYTRMRGAHQHHETAATGPADPLAATLIEVTAELRAIRRILEQRHA